MYPVPSSLTFKASLIIINPLNWFEVDSRGDSGGDSGGGGLADGALVLLTHIVTT